MINKKAFTLIELLVVIAIIALLMSILMPALGMAKEVARRLICATHLKALGTGLHLYAQENNGKMIPNARMGNEYLDGLPPNRMAPWWSYSAGRDVNPTNLLRPLQLGKLYSLQYIEDIRIFYCPTAEFISDGGSNKDIKYYTEDLVKFLPPDESSSGWGIPNEPMGNGKPENKVRSNYMYWTWTETSLADVPHKAMVVDSLSSIAHKRAGRPFGVNALFSGGNVSTTTIAGEPLILDYVDNGGGWRPFEEALKSLRP